MTSDNGSPQPVCDTAALHEIELAAVRARREALLRDASEAGVEAELRLPRVGLALSGGGVRSATFSLGLLRGMAQNRHGATPQPSEPGRRSLVSDGLLGRVDYLSTVSGGGYTGAMFGRLVTTHGLSEAQALLARSDSPVLAWLRRNGRYLTPSGSRDLGVATVTYLRAWLAIHTEFLFASMLFGLLIITPHLLQHSTHWLETRGWQHWHTLWWALAALVWMALAPALTTAYWAGRDGSDSRRRGLPGLGLLILMVAVTAGFVHFADPRAADWRRNSLTGSSALALAFASATAGLLGAQIWLACQHARSRTLAVARLRNLMTRWLTRVTQVALFILGMGVLDCVSWWILEELQTGNRWLWGGLGLGGVLLLVLRALVPLLQRLAAQASEHAGRWLPRALNLFGYSCLLTLVLVWLVLMQWFVFAPEPFEGFDDLPAALRAAIVFGIWLLWLSLTAGHAQMANTSSLHSFYRARLTRAYLAVGNRRRALGAAESAPSSAADVTRVVEGDDLPFDSYRPEARGGPLHLVNVCLNQTRDNSSGLYNADRKGTLLTASCRGFEVGPGRFIGMQPEYDAGTLGQWVAVSGAAASPGAGSYTSRGMALVLYFLGVRLGHWVRSPMSPPALGWRRAFWWRCAPKPAMLTSEASATFFGMGRPWWYLSDGGHFDNTGVYALLKRELDFIVLSDASCDACYTCGDLENLVRKARIDFGAEIDFYTRDEAARLFSLAGSDLTVLSPEDMADNHSCRGVLLARIRYRERPGSRGPLRPEGTLLVIKPNLHDALDVDVLAYARQHAAFPHESTRDQSFDEAQWESYHRLGEDFGRALHETWLAQLPGWRAPARHGLRVAARLRHAHEEGVAAVARDGAASALWRRSGSVGAAAIGTTLGLGASGTLLLSLWQVQDQLQRVRADQQTEARQLLAEVSKGLENFGGSCPQVSEWVTTQASLLFDLRGSPGLRPIENAGVERLASRIAAQCAAAEQPKLVCAPEQAGSRSDLCALALKPVTQSSALDYWNPGASPKEQRQAVAALWGRLTAREPADQMIASGGNSPPAPTTAVTPLPAESETPGGATSTREPIALAGCQRPSGPFTLYMQVHDEASRVLAETYRQRLQTLSNAMRVPIQVAPIENVGRTAELREQRRPIPWAQATFVVHDAAGRPCAEALRWSLGEPWVVGGNVGRVSVRELPGTFSARPGVIELWLPSALPTKGGL